MAMKLTFFSKRVVPFGLYFNGSRTNKDGGQEEFAVSRGAKNRAGKFIQQLKPQPSHTAADFFHCLAMEAFLPDNSSLAHLSFSHLKLRLHQHQQPGSGLAELDQLGENHR